MNREEINLRSERAQQIEQPPCHLIRKKKFYHCILGLCSEYYRNPNNYRKTKVNRSPYSHYNNDFSSNIETHDQSRNSDAQLEATEQYNGVPSQLEQVNAQVVIIRQVQDVSIADANQIQVINHNNNQQSEEIGTTEQVQALSMVDPNQIQVVNLNCDQKSEENGGEESIKSNNQSVSTHISTQVSNNISSTDPQYFSCDSIIEPESNNNKGLTSENHSIAVSSDSQQRRDSQLTKPYDNMLLLNPQDGFSDTQKVFLSQEELDESEMLPQNPIITEQGGNNIANVSEQRQSINSEQKTDTSLTKSQNNNLLLNPLGGLTETADAFSNQELEFSFNYQQKPNRTLTGNLEPKFCDELRKSIK